MCALLSILAAGLPGEACNHIHVLQGSSSLGIVLEVFLISWPVLCLTFSSCDQLLTLLGNARLWKQSP